MLSKHCEDTIMQKEATDEKQQEKRTSEQVESEAKETRLETIVEESSVRDSEMKKSTAGGFEEKIGETRVSTITAVENTVGFNTATEKTAENTTTADKNTMSTTTTEKTMTTTSENSKNNPYEAKKISSWTDERMLAIVRDDMQSSKKSMIIDKLKAEDQFQNFGELNTAQSQAIRYIKALYIFGEDPSNGSDQAPTRKYYFWPYDPRLHPSDFAMLTLRQVGLLNSTEHEETERNQWQVLLCHYTEVEKMIKQQQQQQKNGLEIVRETIFSSLEAIQKKRIMKKNVGEQSILIIVKRRGTGTGTGQNSSNLLRSQVNSNSSFSGLGKRRSANDKDHLEKETSRQNKRQRLDTAESSTATVIESSSECVSVRDAEFGTNKKGSNTKKAQKTRKKNSRPTSQSDDLYSSLHITNQPIDADTYSQTLEQIKQRAVASKALGLVQTKPQTRAQTQQANSNTTNPEKSQSQKSKPNIFNQVSRDQKYIDVPKKGWFYCVKSMNTLKEIEGLPPGECTFDSQEAIQRELIDKLNLQSDKYCSIKYQLMDDGKHLNLVCKHCSSFKYTFKVQYAGDGSTRYQLLQKWVKHHEKSKHEDVAKEIDKMD